MKYKNTVKGITLTHLAIGAILLDFSTETGSNHTGTLDTAATEQKAK